ncbi:hypothetical protein H2203_004561 [Taxawa tesnikishii (nom. ined.)]|nr:hypothetical protein H2203_004561 [Dothideales sp. JES 119]
MTSSPPVTTTIRLAKVAVATSASFSSPVAHIPTPTNTAAAGAIEQGPASNRGAIIAGTTGSMAGLAMIGTVVFFLLKRKKKQDAEDKA